VEVLPGFGLVCYIVFFIIDIATRRVHTRAFREMLKGFGVTSRSRPTPILGTAWFDGVNA